MMICKITNSEKCFMRKFEGRNVLKLIHHHKICIGECIAEMSKLEKWSSEINIVRKIINARISHCKKCRCDYSLTVTVFVSSHVTILVLSRTFLVFYA